MNVLLMIKESLLRALNYVSTIGVSDILDILIVAFLIYKISGFVRKTSSSKVAKGVLVLFVLLWVSSILKLNVINFLLRSTLEVGMVAIVILFQPELRRGLEKMGTGRFPGFAGSIPQVYGMETVITQTLLACSDMQKTKTGALMVFERDNLLDSALSSGTAVDAKVTAELLKNIFYPNTPLHDGAVIIRGTRIAAAGCVLPLTSNTNLSSDLGMRHRAGIGMSENSDAVVIIISEEKGSVSVAVDGMLKRNLTTETLEKLLRNELMSKDDDNDQKGRGFFARIFR